MRTLLAILCTLGPILAAAGPARGQPPDETVDEQAPEQEAPAQDTLEPAEEEKRAPDPEDAAPRSAVGDAKTHIRLARAYYDSGRFGKAAEEFRAAYEASDDPRLLYNLFLALRDAGRIDGAIEALARYLRLVPDAPRREQLEARLANMRRLQEQRDRTGGEPEEQGPAQDDAPEQGEEGQAPDPADADLDPKDGETKSDEIGVRAGTRSSPSLLSWVIMGVGAAALGGGTATGVLALRKERTLEDACGPDGLSCPPGFASDVDRGKTLATATDILLGLGLVGMGAGLAIWLLLDEHVQERAPTTPDAPTASVGCGRSGCHGSVTVRF